MKMSTQAGSTTPRGDRKDWGNPTRSHRSNRNIKVRKAYT